MHFRSRGCSAFFCLLAAIALGHPAVAQQGVPGVLTPQGTFRPTAPMATTPADTTTYTGSYTATINISIVSDAAHLDPSTLVCTLTIMALDVSGGSDYNETDTIPATVSGSTASCRPVIPYNWKFGTNDTVEVEINYSVYGTNSAGVGRTTSATGATVEASVPANGTTTRLAYGVRI